MQARPEETVNQPGPDNTLPLQGSARLRYGIQEEAQIHLEGNPESRRNVAHSCRLKPIRSSL